MIKLLILRNENRPALVIRAPRPLPRRAFRPIPGVLTTRLLSVSGTFAERGAVTCRMGAPCRTPGFRHTGEARDGNEARPRQVLVCRRGGPAPGRAGRRVLLNRPAVPVRA